MRLIKANGVAVSLHYSDVLYIKLVSKDRLLLQMRNDDEFDLRGRDLHKIMLTLEDRRMLVLAECNPNGCAVGEPVVQLILGVVFEDLPKTKPEPETPGGLINHRTAQMKF